MIKRRTEKGKRCLCRSNVPIHPRDRSKGSTNIKLKVMYQTRKSKLCKKKKKGKISKVAIIRATWPHVRVWGIAIVIKLNHHCIYYEIPSEMLAGWRFETHRIWATPTDRRHGRSKLNFSLLLYKVHFTRDTVYNYYEFTHFCLCFRRVCFCVQRKKKNVKNMSASLSEMWSEGSYCLVHKRRAHATKVQECRWTNI